ncbi:DNA polymerase IV [Caballeronia terrestris]|uniref:DNA polymerase IV n=1 Tax=Caballeronia terrestris TaxID=1226301 RepID=A0A158IWP5_9BURK|nr:DNA polymerase IV [Caballeronia terrestris]SAL60998.1 DNA polymerase IV [Caballeronia terrestris]
MSELPRRIAHLDMDAFFASVELLRYPELRGQAVVVGGGHRSEPTVDEHGKRHFVRLREYAGRGVVTTSTYEARKLGVFSAMGMMKAAQLAPDAILLPSNFDSYRHYSELFKSAVATIAPRIENRGIDEIYIDLTDVPGETRTLAQRIKRVVADTTGLSCSIAVAPNKLLAKIGSELDKPDGLTLLTFDDLQTRIWPLPAKKVNGIGPKANDRLAALGIHTVGDIAAADPALLQQQFGLSYATWLTRIAAGIDDREIETSSVPRSKSRETTFSRDLHPRRDRAELSERFTDLCVRLAEDLERRQLTSACISIKVRFSDFRTVTRDHTLEAGVADAASIRRAATECLKRVTLDRSIRLLGVKASALSQQSVDGSAPKWVQSEMQFDASGGI